MAKKMLIDATHAEETRVVVVDGNKVEEFDFEAAAKRQLAGNIYLAKVTRVEPSLQAAFVDYGGNRHGFLAFSEIHPDYYQIPVADREALLAEERALAASEDEEDEERSRSRGRSRTRSRTRPAAANGDAVATAEPATEGDAEAPVEIAGMEMIDLGEGDADVEGAPEGLSPMATVADTPVDTPAADEALPETPDAGEDRGNLDVVEKDDTIETVAEEDDTLDMRPRQKPRMRRYKIQEVVKVRQIMLVQVVKEERGNKGAALTTYLSLAGRYCVLMPNTARGGGISRKITNAVDRKKLKEIAGELDVPQGAGLIIRTAGSQRTKAEIKRDYEYLQRLWEQIRELTLKSIAPAKIYEEGDLIKRSIRDLYSKDIDEVIVEGVEGYRTAKDFMKMIMPSHARAVQPYADPMPLFARHQVEGYLAGMFNPTVQLPSGGYIVIGVTEALVAIDVNSGRATKEGSIEQTALKTNLEAADEIARQLRLRDLAGLIVVDFIDMDERRNNASVEKRFKDRLKTDRARIQVGRISGFGLLEMSRQRLRPGMLEATTQPCPHCHGTGLLRSDDNVSLGILRQLEEEGVRGRSKEVLVKAPVGIVNFLMNHKREHIAGIEQRYGMAVRIEADLHLVSPDFTLEKFKTATRAIPEAPTAITGNASLMGDLVEEDEDIIEADEAEEDAAPETAEASETAEAQPAGEDGDKPKKKRRRRRRRRNGDRPEEAGSTDAEGDGEDEAEGGADEAPEPAAEPEVAEAAEPVAEKPRRTRSRRKPAAAGEAVAEAAVEAVAEVMPEAVAAEPAPAPAAKPARTRRKPAAQPAADAAAETPAEAAPKPARSRSRKKAVAAETPDAPEPEPVADAADLPEPGPVPAAVVDPVVEVAELVEAPVTSVADVVEFSEEVVLTSTTPEPAPAAVRDPDRPRRRGWWSKG